MRISLKRAWNVPPENADPYFCIWSESERQVFGHMLSPHQLNRIRGRVVLSSCERGLTH
jgi:hypothetical protein